MVNKRLVALLFGLAIVSFGCVAYGQTIADSFQYPLQTPWNIVQGFGVWSNWEGGYHLGEDVPAQAGTPVYAAANGVVKFAVISKIDETGQMTCGKNYIGVPGYCAVVIIEHTLSDGTQVTTLYGHLSSILGLAVATGNTVVKGQLIGYIAYHPTEDGKSTGSHLHFAIRAGAYTTARICGHWAYLGHSVNCDGVTDSQYLSAWYRPSEFINQHLQPSNQGTRGSPPTVTGVTMPAQINGRASWSVYFTDPDGDVSELLMDIWSDGSWTLTNDWRVAARGITSGYIPMQTTCYGVSSSLHGVQLIDAVGHKSPWYNFNINCVQAAASGLDIGTADAGGSFTALAERAPKNQVPLVLSRLGSTYRFTALGQGAGTTEIQVSDLNGGIVFAGVIMAGQAVVWRPQGITGRPLANGVYLAVVMVRSAAGVVIMREVRNIVLRR